MEYRHFLIECSGKLTQSILMVTETIEAKYQQMECRHLLTLYLNADPSIVVGRVPSGYRIINPFTGGHFSGPGLRGTILAWGGGSILARRDGTAEMDARAILKTEDDAIIYLRYEGSRHGPPEILAKIGKEILDPKSYYMRMRPVFETADPRYAWLNGTVSVGYGDRRPEGAIYHLYEIFER
jgi:Protein of unknown function (DUF3237)